ncbi:MAG: rod shape-determining protein MreC [bacterium]|nr:rod shape-determining protein MreC [Candidatus Colisoma equi]
MKAGRFGIIVAGAVAIGALVLIEFVPSIVGEAVYPVERFKALLVRIVRNTEDSRLRRESEAFSMVREECARLRAENAALRETLGYRARCAGKWEVAEVLSSGGGAAAVRDVIRVGKGSLAGIREGAAAVVPKGLVGKVVLVSPHASEVLLLTDPSIRVSCGIETANGVLAHGILMGADSDRMILAHLSGAERVLPHAKVVTSGLGGVFPKGIEIGTLLLVTNGVRGVEGEVLPSVDPATLEEVFIRCDQ